ncbi:thioesterase II family protein [Streptomyces sp. DT171]|uniref:thioesterase II family protein n=1 Tax=Streptomyces sp. DT171 TaxID=3416524 RepID=UPI003CFBACC7
MDGHASDDELWLRRYHPAPGAGVQLVCFPHAGGSASAFFAMAQALASCADVLAVQYPGRQDRRSEACVDSIPRLVDRIVPVLARRTDDRPLALFGHSMGATVVFEVARRMEGSGGRAPLVLFVSGRRPPESVRAESVHLRDDRGILAELDLLGGSLSAALTDPEIRAMVMPSIRSDYRAAETYTYTPGPPLTCPVVALTGDADPRAAVEEVAGWRAYTEGRFTLRVFEGGHFFLNDRPTAVQDAVRDHLGALRVPGPDTR